jgi:AraC-like DNA-binding protein
MQRAPTIEDFVADPVGRFSVGVTHVVWCASPSLCGTVHWGRPTAASAGELVRRLAFTGHAALAGGCDGFIDAGAVEAFEWPAFAVLAELARERVPEWGRRLRRHAVVVPPGVVGAIVAGLLPLVGSTHPLRFFGVTAEALAWLARPELTAAIAELGPIVDEARGTAPLIRRLRDYLERLLPQANIVAAAQALAVSPRTLQRELTAHGTHFTAELMQARLRAARTLLETSDDKIESIAVRVGCGSSSRLSRLFSRFVGETPGRYRARCRAANARREVSAAWRANAVRLA